MASHPGAFVKQHQFTETTPDGVRVHIQVLDMGEQLFVWLGCGNADLKTLCLAVPTRLDPVPAIATLLPDTAGDTSASLARRLATRLQRPVMCSCSIDGISTPMVQAVAEKRLVQELAALASAQQAEV